MKKQNHLNVNDLMDPLIERIGQLEKEKAFLIAQVTYLQSEKESNTKEPQVAK
jgi:uncharacterized protein (UPF0335 family)